MPTYRWTFTCEEMYDDENNTVNVTTKTLLTDSETFTDCLVMLPQLINGVGFFVEPESFTYQDESFEDWANDSTETRLRVIKQNTSPPGFVGDFSRWTGFEGNDPYVGFPPTY